MKRTVLTLALCGSLTGCAIDPVTATLGVGAMTAGYMATRDRGQSGETPTGTPQIPDGPLSLWWYAGAALATMVGYQKLKKEGK